MSITRHLFSAFLMTVLVSSGVCAQDQTVPAMVDSLLQESATEDTDEDEEIPFVYDSALVKTRSLDPATLREMQADPEMDYGESSPAVVSLWDRLKMLLFGIISWLFYMGESTEWGNVIVGILVVGVLSFVILRLLKIDALKMFRSRSRGTMQHTILEENIHEMDFDKLIADALADHAYRLAIRLTFLHSLKILADRHHIQWEPGKTNYDYLLELKAAELRTGFRELNFYFENAWYGNFAITGEHYRRVNGIFTTWKTNVR